VRYVRCRCQGFVPRLGYALTAVVRTRNQAGAFTPNYAQIAGPLAAEAIVRLWLPPSERSATHFAERAVFDLGIRGLSNSLHEFTPELKRAFHRE
jgi:hypothetical protein